MQLSRSLPALAFILAVLGAALCATALVIHHRMAESQWAYTSFCDISEHFSCDAVLGSSYAIVLGLPVAGWAMLSYLGASAVVLALAGTRGDARLRVAATLLALTGAMLAVSLYFFAIASFVIGVICPICLSLDAVTIALFTTALLIVRSLRPIAPRGWPASRSVFAASSVTLIAIVALAVLQWPRAPSSLAMSVEQVREEDPRFYAWYISQPLSDPGKIEGRHAEGDASAPITLVEFSDFECPHCGRAYADLSRALEKGAQDVRLVYRHFPLNSDCNPQVQTRVHTRACQAAVAAECAGAQGKFWPYQRLLFEHQDALDSPSLLGYAARLSLDQAEFERCLSSPAAAAAVAEDVAAGAAAGVVSTPTFFINGRRISGSMRGAEHYLYALAIERARLAQSAAKESAKP